MAALDSIEVWGYKSIQHMRLDLGPLNVLIGANGAGKSNVISLFTFLNELLEQRLNVYVGRMGGASQVLHHGPKTTAQLRIDLRFGQNGYSAKLLPTATDRFIFQSEEGQYFGSGHDRAFTEPLGTGHNESRLRERTDKPVIDYVVRSIASWRLFHFHDTSDTAVLKRPGPIHDNQTLRPDASNLAAFLYRLQRTHTDHYHTIRDTLRQIAPFFADFSLRPDPLNPEMIRLEWQDRSSDAYFSAASLSDGTLRFICLATLLLQPTLPTTIVIDEPELGLHPAAIGVLAGLLESAATQTQVIVATQSVSLISQFAPETLVVIDRENGHSTVQRITDAQLNGWLEDYSLGEIWEKNLIGGRP